MINYNLFLSLSLFFYFVYSYSKRDALYISRISLLFSFLILIIFSGFRSSIVGTDSDFYVRLFDRSDKIENTLEFGKSTFEYLFSFWNFIARSISEDYAVIFIMNALLICYLYVNTINHLSKYKFYSFFIFIALGYYTFHFNGARQGIALAIFFYSFKFCLTRKLFKYILTIIIGFFFHKSIIICLPLYFLTGNRLSIYKTVIFTILFAILIVNFDSLVSFLAVYDNRYAGYSEQTEVIGGLISSLSIIFLFIFYFISRHINKINNVLFDKALVFFFLSFLISIAFLILKVNPNGLLRSTLYFTQFSIYLLPLSIASYSNSNVRVILIAFFTVFLLTYFYLTTSNFSHLVPYEFNFNFLQ